MRKVKAFPANASCRDKVDNWAEWLRNDRRNTHLPLFSTVYFTWRVFLRENLRELFYHSSCYIVSIYVRFVGWLGSGWTINEKIYGLENNTCWRTVLATFDNKIVYLKISTDFIRNCNTQFPPGEILFTIVFVRLAEGVSNFTPSTTRPPVIFSYSLMCIWDAKLPLGGCQSAGVKWRDERAPRWEGEVGNERKRRVGCFVITSPDKWTRDSLIPPPQLRIIGDPSNQPFVAFPIFRTNYILRNLRKSRTVIECVSSCNLDILFDIFRKVSKIHVFFQF